jgi:hypothetical protein
MFIIGQTRLEDVVEHPFVVVLEGGTSVGGELDRVDRLEDLLLSSIPLVTPAVDFLFETLTTDHGDHLVEVRLGEILDIIKLPGGEEGMERSGEAEHHIDLPFLKDFILKSKEDISLGFLFIP